MVKTMKNLLFTSTKVLGVAAVLSLVNACSTTPSANFGVSAANRTIPERLIDEGIERVALKNLPNVAGLENMSEQNLRVVIDSFRREVLLTGEVPNEQIKINIHNMIASMKDVTKVYNYLTVTPYAKGQTHTMHENFLKSKIRARIISGRTVKTPQYKIVVRNDEVYVLGYLTPSQQNSILEAIGFTTGIQNAHLLTNLINHNGEIITANDVMTDTAAYAEDNSNGAVYGGGHTNVGFAGTNTNPRPVVQPATGQPKNLVEPSVVKMEQAPSTGYVKLYNGTNKP